MTTTTTTTTVKLTVHKPHIFQDKLEMSIHLSKFNLYVQLFSTVIIQQGNCHRNWTNYMEQSPWQVTSCSASQAIPHLLWNWKFITMFTCSLCSLSWPSSHLPTSFP